MCWVSGRVARATTRSSNFVWAPAYGAAGRLAGPCRAQRKARARQAVIDGCGGAATLYSGELADAAAGLGARLGSAGRVHVAFDTWMSRCAGVLSGFEPFFV